jgi:queuine tRNA-ribosyltransferase
VTFESIARVATGYKLVKLANGAHCVRSLADEETFHPGIGPAGEAAALYVQQLHLGERVRSARGDFVIWDVGLGAAGNALTVIRLVREHLAGAGESPRATAAPRRLRMVSFDRTSDAVAFALEHAAQLGYPAGYEAVLNDLRRNHYVTWGDCWLTVEWKLVLGDFPALLSGSEEPGAGRSPRPAPDEGRIVSSSCAGSETGAPIALPSPHAILFDPHSPKRNPEMWAVRLFADLFGRLDPRRPCVLATFSRSTMARIALLLGGFFVGAGHPSGSKEETTVASNQLALLEQPLDRRWLERAKRSDSAEPLREPVYRQAPLSAATWEALCRHPQFGRIP